MVTRYELPRIAAFQFTCLGIVDGGVNTSLALDTHGKSLSYRLLAMPVEVPPARAGARG
jgi:hypothetical protein